MHARRGRQTRRHDERRRVHVQEGEGAERNAEPSDLRHAKPDQPKPIRRRYDYNATDYDDPLPPVEPEYRLLPRSLGSELSKLQGNFQGVRTKIPRDSA
jgi:hypothetical protein